MAELSRQERQHRDVIAKKLVRGCVWSSFPTLSPGAERIFADDEDWKDLRRLYNEVSAGGFNKGGPAGVQCSTDGLTTSLRDICRNDPVFHHGLECMDTWHLVSQLQNLTAEPWAVKPEKNKEDHEKSHWHADSDFTLKNVSKGVREGYCANMLKVMRPSVFPVGLGTTDGRHNFACAVVGPIVTPVPSFMERQLQTTHLCGPKAHLMIDTYATRRVCTGQTQTIRSVDVLRKYSRRR
jgi:hypothetical protein